VRPLRSPSFHPSPHIVTPTSAVAVKAAHFARPPGLGLDGREHGDNIRVRRGSEYSIRTLQNADEKHGASTDFLNRCTWYLIPRPEPASALGYRPNSPAIADAANCSLWLCRVITAGDRLGASLPRRAASASWTPLAGRESAT